MPEPANDVGVEGVDFVVIGGLSIPQATFDEWESAFRDINVRAGVLKLASWATSKVKPENRITAIQTTLAKNNEEAAKARMLAKAEAEARAAAPPPPQPPKWDRFQMPDNPETRAVFSGRRVFLYHKEFDHLVAQFPELDIWAEIRKFDAEPSDLTNSENRRALVLWMEERAAEVKASKVA